MAYDPVFTDLDKDFLASLGIQVKVISLETTLTIGTLGGRLLCHEGEDIVLPSPLR